MSTVTERLPLIKLPVDEHKRGLGVIEVGSGAQKRQLPLSGVDIQARVAERVASVTVKQTFRNTYSEHLEATYIFPLSGGCTVNDFELRVGARVVKGIVKERGAARIEYQQALQDGHRAALLEQERDDVFTMQVGNIPPDEEVSVVITYSEKLPFFEDGRTELRLPLVVADRYIAGADVGRQSVGAGTHADTTIVPDASRITPPLLAKGFDPKVNLVVNVELEQTGDPIDELSCSQHATRLGITNGAVKIELAKDNERLNRDFVLQWRLAGKSLKNNLIVFRGSDGDYGMLSLIPPKRDGYLGAARDVVFVLDRSGSMSGIKMVSAVRACSMLLNTLGPTDRFAICAFDDVLDWMPGERGKQDSFRFADENGLAVGEKFLRSIGARGGTEMYNALDGTLQTIHNRSNSMGRVPVIVLLTDGEVGDEARILKLVQKQARSARLFAVGIDTAVNSGLLRRVANLGGGTATFVQPGAVLEHALQVVGREIGSPLVTDIEIDPSSADAIDGTSVTPQRLPDLFAGRASTAFFKLTGKGTVRIRGRYADGGTFDEKVKATTVNMPAIAQLWAKSRVTDLEDSYRIGPSDAIKQQIIDLAVKHSILTKFTAFVAVDETEVVNADGTLRKVIQPVEQADSWEMYDQLSAAPAPQAMGAYGCAPPPGCAPASAAPGAPQRSAWGSSTAQNFIGAPLPAETTGNAPSPAQPPQPMNALSQSMFGKLQKQKSNKDRSDKQERCREMECIVDESTAIKAAISRFAAVLEKAYDSIKNGTLPDVKSIEEAWQKLLDTLCDSALGTEVPEMQKFLRGAAVELIDSLRQPGVTAANLQPLWERHLDAFTRVQADTTIRLERVESGVSEPFWEASI